MPYWGPRSSVVQTLHVADRYKVQCGQCDELLEGRGRGDLRGGVGGT